MILLFLFNKREHAHCKRLTVIVLICTTTGHREQLILTNSQSLRGGGHRTATHAAVTRQVLYKKKHFMELCLHCTVKFSPLEGGQNQI